MPTEAVPFLDSIPRGVTPVLHSESNLGTPPRLDPGSLAQRKDMGLALLVPTH